MPASPSTIADRRYKLYDNALELRAYTASALSATGSSTGVAFDVSTFPSFEVIVNVAAHTGYSAGSAFWTITVEVSDTLGSGYVTVGSYTPDGTAKEARIAVDCLYGELLKSNAAYIRVTATKTSTAGNLTYGAYLNPCC